MLAPYYGEFMIIPMPVELSLERCSNLCGYCFSNLNNYRLKVSIQSIFNHVAHFNQRNDPASRLIKAGYPICMSNRSDLFCERNYKNAITLLQVMAELEIDVAFQTKTGQGIDEVIDFFPKSCWYISVSFDDDTLCKKIEPGAPAISDRLKTIEKLTSKGHTVAIGMNPFVPEWIKDKRSLLSKFKEIGVYGLYIEGLHFSGEQIKQIKTKAIDKKIIERTKKRPASGYEQEQYIELRNMAYDMGFSVFSFWNDRYCDFWEPYQKRYKCFPVITDFINYCFQNKKDGDIIDYQEFRHALGPFPNYKYKIDSYLLSINRSFRNVNIPAYGTINSLLKFYWTDRRLTASPWNYSSLAMVAEWDAEDEIYRIDDDLPTYMWKESGWTSHFVNIEGKEI